jgi:hypothetical protein
MASHALRRVTPAAEPPGDVEDVALVVRKRRIQFDMDREYIDGTSGRIAAGWTVRFFALQDKGTHVVPACPCCRRVALELRRVAATVLCDGSLEADVEVGVVRPALYESRSLRGRDEVALPVRIWPQSRAPLKPGVEDGYAGALRRHLTRFGLAES